MPCSEKRARLLLTRGRAVVHRRYPFTIRLKDCGGGDVQPVRVKIDPGTKTTGVAIIAEEDRNQPAEALCLFELVHRGRLLRLAGRVGGYKAPRFDNRTHATGWPVLDRPVVALDTRPGALRRARSV
jgi:hypothetical protein